MPHPKFGRSLPTTAATAPATFRLIHLQVVGREQMAITADFGASDGSLASPSVIGREQMAMAADRGYGHGLRITLQRKAHHMNFGCSKARPRYHFEEKGH